MMTADFPSLLMGSYFLILLRENILFKMTQIVMLSNNYTTQRRQS